MIPNSKLGLVLKAKVSYYESSTLKSATSKFGIVSQSLAIKAKTPGGETNKGCSFGRLVNL